MRENGLLSLILSYKSVGPKIKNRRSTAQHSPQDAWPGSQDSTVFFRNVVHYLQSIGLPAQQQSCMDVLVYE